MMKVVYGGILYSMNRNDTFTKLLYGNLCLNYVVGLYRL